MGVWGADLLTLLIRIDSGAVCFLQGRARAATLQMRSMPKHAVFKMMSVLVMDPFHMVVTILQAGKL